MREKLYSLIHNFLFEGAEVSDMNLADHLIANGVTIPVRCKDCKHTETDGCSDPAIYCKKWDRWEMPEDFFCSYGERKDK